jgi:hypothetical protein
MSFRALLAFSFKVDLMTYFGIIDYKKTYEFGEIAFQNGGEIQDARQT